MRSYISATGKIHSAEWHSDLVWNVLWRRKLKNFSKMFLSMLIYTIKCYMFQLLVGCRWNEPLVYEEKIEISIKDLIF
jgi:hypothetical protein